MCDKITIRRVPQEIQMLHIFLYYFHCFFRDNNYGNYNYDDNYNPFDDDENYVHIIKCGRYENLTKFFFQKKKKNH